MKTYTKRIAFVLAKQHLIAHGGLGQFALGMARMCRELGWKMDIVTDQPARESEFVDRLTEEGVTNIVAPKDPLPYSKHAGIFAFADSMNFEKMANFRSAMMRALETNVYDCVVCNTYESVPGIYALDLHWKIPLVYYTHNEFMVFRSTRKVKNVFTESFNAFFIKLMELPGLTVGTQTERNLNEFRRNGATGRVLGMPVTEASLRDCNFGPREGVLFIGRWEPGKQPQEYLDVIKATGLPARVLTNSNGARKFEEWFRENGISDYKIGEGLTGQAKVDFIRNCRVHLNTSLRENYSLAFFECLGQMPCIVREKAEWRHNFSEEYYTVSSDENLAAMTKQHYEREMSRHSIIMRSSYVENLDADAKQNWFAFLDSQTHDASGSSAAKINTINGRYSDFITSLGRTSLAVDDVKSVYNNLGKFRVIYTDNNTYLTTDPTFTPNESEGSLDELFA